MLGAELMYHFGNVAILTAFVAAFVLWRYRVAILAGMQGESGAALPVPALQAPDRSWAGPEAGALGSARSGNVLPALAWENYARRRIASAYLLSVGLPACALTGFYLKQSDLPISPSYFVALASIILSAAIPMIAVSLAVPFWRALGHWLLLLSGGVALALVLVVAQRAANGKLPTLQIFLLVWSFCQLAASQLWLPLLLLFATGSKRLRGVAPITFAGLLVFGLAPLAGSRLTHALASTQVGSGWVLSLGMNAVFVLLALPVGWIAWWRLRGLASEYENKRFSDAQLLARTWWLIFVACTGLELIGARPNPLSSFAGCVLAYALFPAANRYVLARAGLARARPAPRTLLLLRVFGYTGRTERLFDRVGARWRLFGPVTMIAAPDVIARTVDPAEFLRFVTGNVGDIFVQSQADLDARLRALDLAPDPDGRYRVSEFCCRDDTWQATVVALMQRCDAVIMDVRGVTAARHGCEFELQQLAARVPAQKVVLVTDCTTDQAFIEQATSGRRGDLRLVTVERDANADMQRLFEALLEAAAWPAHVRAELGAA